MDLVPKLGGIRVNFLGPPVWTSVVNLALWLESTRLLPLGCSTAGGMNKTVPSAPASDSSVLLPWLLLCVNPLLLSGGFKESPQAASLFSNSRQSAHAYRSRSCPFSFKSSSFICNCRGSCVFSFSFERSRSISFRSRSWRSSVGMETWVSIRPNTFPWQL